MAGRNKATTYGIHSTTFGLQRLALYQLVKVQVHGLFHGELIRMNEVRMSQRRRKVPIERHQRVKQPSGNLKWNMSATRSTATGVSIDYEADLSFEYTWLGDVIRLVGG